MDGGSGAFIYSYEHATTTIAHTVMLFSEMHKIHPKDCITH